MATMPDLNLNEVGVMAYWNIADEGYDSENIDWGEVTDGYDSYTTYDNGYVGTITRFNRDYTIRTKTDGWVVCYLDGTDSLEAEDGPWDMFHWSWNNYDTDAGIGSDRDYLADAIRQIVSHLSESPSVLAENLYYYNALSPDATNLSLITAQNTYSPDFEFTPSGDMVIERATAVKDSEYNTDAELTNTDDSTTIIDEYDVTTLERLGDTLELDTTYDWRSDGSTTARVTMLIWWW